MRNQISLSIHTIEDTKVTAEVTDVPRVFKSFLSKYQTTNTYPHTVQQIPDGILIIPFAMTLAPIAWLTGTNVRINELDANFHSCLKRVRLGFDRLYPDARFVGKGGIVPDRIKDLSAPHSTDRPAMLFSGGVDSMATYFTNSDKNPILLTIQGSDVPLSNTSLWSRVRSNAEEFAEDQSTQSLSIKSEFQEWLRWDVLDMYYQNMLGRTWWGAIQYFLDLPTICAPTVYSLGSRTLFFSGGYSSDPTKPGDQPYIVNEIEWAGSVVEYTLNDYSRQERTDIIAEQLSPGKDSWNILSCWQPERYLNCSNCEKCYRNIVSLLIAGVDPELYGFEVDDETFKSIRRAFEQGEIHFNEIDLMIWRELQDARSPLGTLTSYEIENFFDWFMSANLSDYVTSEENPEWIHQYNTVASELPYPLDVLSLRARNMLPKTLPFN